MPYVSEDVGMVDVEEPLREGGYHIQRYYTLDPIRTALRDDLREGDSVFQEFTVYTSLDVDVLAPLL